MKKNLLASILLVLIAHLCVFAQKPKSKTSAEIIPKKMRPYDRIFGFYDPNLCLVSNENRFGFIDRNGKEVIPTIYEFQNLSLNKKGQIPVHNKENGFWGVIDRQNNVVIPFRYRTLESVGEYFAVSLKGESEKTLINSKQEAILKGSYGGIKYLGKNLYAVYKNRKWLVINSKEEVLKELSYDYVENNVGQGLTVIADKNNMYGLIDSLGKEIVPLKYTKILGFSEGLARVESTDRLTKEHLYGFIDPTGKEVIDAKYKNAGSKFSEGLVPVHVKFRGAYSWGYINKNEKMVIDPWFSFAEIFSDGFARVGTEWHRVGYIDRQGKFSGMYEEAGTYHNGLAEVTINGKKAFIDTKHRVVIETDPNAAKLLQEPSMPVEEAPRQLEQSIAPDKPSKAVEVGLDKPKEESVAQQQEEMVFSVVETPPVFFGGNDSLKRFIIKHMIWPKEALENKITGVVSANFIVEKDGTITQPAIDSPRLCNGCDEEALRLLSIMPKWKPGEQSRRKVRVRYKIPISFNPADYQK